MLFHFHKIFKKVGKNIKLTMFKQQSCRFTVKQTVKKPCAHVNK